MTEGVYLALALSLLTVHVGHLDQPGSRAFYPGRPSNHGLALDGLEGFSRMAPVSAAWIASGRDNKSGDTNMITVLQQGILAGTNPRSPGYWDDIEDMDQRIVEAADVALALYISRNQIWNKLETNEQKRIAKWLGQVNGKKVPDNNWHLFVALTNAVLKSLGEEYDADALRNHYTRFKSFYRGGGWFADGSHGSVDYYNAWGMQWALLWLDQIDPELDRDFIRSVHREFARSFIYFFTPNGFPIMGRSVCYRLALPAPLVLGRVFGINDLPDGEVRRALNVTWQYFLRHGAVDNGRVSQGYWRDDRRLLEHYTGPASCLWSLRSLTAVLMSFTPPQAGAGSVPAPFWDVDEEPLPVERGDFTINLEYVGWRLRGTQASKEVTLEQIRPKIRQRRDRRKYGLMSYSSRLPYFYRYW